MKSREKIGGVVHVYQRFDPVRFPSPRVAPPDMVSGAFAHLLAHGQLEGLTEEQLARAVRIDPSEITGLGPSLSALIEMLEQRKSKILDTYETGRAGEEATQQFQHTAAGIEVPNRMQRRYQVAVRDEQLRDLERLWYAARNDRGAFARGLVQVMARLGEKYQVDELAGKYTFRGRKSMSVEKAIAVKEELEAIDRLLEQLRQARETGQVALVDMESLAEFAEPGDVDQLGALQQQVQDYLREMARRQGLESTGDGYRLTPRAYRLFQSKVLEEVFSSLVASRTGRHAGEKVGEGTIETPQTKLYEFGDSVTDMDITSSMVNAMVRGGPGLPIRMKGEDIVIHRTRNSPRCATVVVMDMSGSMRHAGLYFNVKRMALALQGLIRSQYPGDYLQFVEIFSFAKPRHASEVVGLMPKPVTIWDPVVRLKADMSDPDISEAMVPPHFTNVQHGLQLARRFLGAQNTPNRQVMLITDGLPTAHFEGETLYLLYPPDPRTEAVTLREAGLCRRDGITINLFLLSSWNQSREDVQFAQRVAETTRGRVLFTGGRDLDRYVLWDYVQQRRKVIG